MFRIRRPSAGLPARGLAFLLCVVLILVQAACMGRPDVVFRLKPGELHTRKNDVSPTKKDASPTEKEIKEGQTSAAKKSEPTEAKSSEKATYDFSREHKVNLADYAGVYYGPPALNENSGALDGLNTLVARFLAERGLSGASIGIVYDDLSASERYCYNADQRFVAASVIKVAMAMVVDQLRQEGAFPQDLQVTYVPGEQFAADSLDPARLGQLVPMSELIDSALLYSDNTATSVVFEYFRRQGRDLHYFMDERTGTRYSNDITMSAREGIGLIEALYYNQGQFPGYSTILSTMSGSSWGQYLTAGIPAAVSSKYGQLGSLNHEIGLVWADRPFAYAVFTDNINAYSVLPELGALLYNYATGQAEIPPSAPVAVPLQTDGLQTAAGNAGAEVPVATDIYGSVIGSPANSDAPVSSLPAAVPVNP